MVGLRQTLAALTAAGAVLGLAVCCSGPPAPTMGTVYKKQYVAQHTWYSQVCSAYRTTHYRYRVGNSYYTSTSTSCVAYIAFPMTTPEEWDLCLRRDRSDTQHAEQGCFSTDPATFQHYEVGMHFPDAR